MINNPNFRTPNEWYVLCEKQGAEIYSLRMQLLRVNMAMHAAIRKCYLTAHVLEKSLKEIEKMTEVKRE